MPVKVKPYITIVTAPEITETERQALEKHWREAVLDPSYIMVLNYEVSVYNVEVDEGMKMVVTAPGLPLGELAKLRERVNEAIAAEKQEDRMVVCNYDCYVSVVE
jgi:hypothetical protein